MLAGCCLSPQVDAYLEVQVMPHKLAQHHAAPQTPHLTSQLAECDGLLAGCVHCLSLQVDVELEAIRTHKYSGAGKVSNSSWHSKALTDNSISVLMQTALDNKCIGRPAATSTAATGTARELKDNIISWLV